MNFNSITKDFFKINYLVYFYSQFILLDVCFLLLLSNCFHSLIKRI